MAHATRQASTDAQEQHGQLDRLELERRGLTRHNRPLLVRRGLLVPTQPGVWSLGAPADEPRARAHGAVKAGGPRALLCFPWAAWLYGWCGLPDTPPSVLVPRGSRRSRATIDYRAARRGVPDADRDEHYGIPVTSPARTVLDAAAAMEDGPFDRLLSDALISPYLRHEALAERAAGEPGSKGVRRLRAGLREAEHGVTRAQSEALLRAAVRAGGLPMPKFNAKVLGRERDAVWEDLHLIVEVQGFRFHATPHVFEDDIGRAAELAAHGWTSQPVGYRTLRDERAVAVARLAGAIAHAEARRDR